MNLRIGDYEVQYEGYLPEMKYLSCYSLELRRQETCTICKRTIQKGEEGYYVEGDRASLKKKADRHFTGLFRCEECKDLHREVPNIPEICFLCEREMFTWVEVDNVLFCHTCRNREGMIEMRKKVKKYKKENRRRGK